jgi:hypothetical protein
VMKASRALTPPSASATKPRLVRRDLHVAGCRTQVLGSEGNHLRAEASAGRLANRLRRGEWNVATSH